MRLFEFVVAQVAARGNLIEVTASGPEPGALPGQVCLALADVAEQPWLRVALHLAPRAGGAAFYIPVTHSYARLQPGDRLELLGPCGRGFRLPAGAAHLLVVAGSLERLLPAIEHALRQGLAVTCLTPRRAELLPADVEIHRGPLTAELATWADVVLLDVADPQARARHIRGLAPPRPEAYVQALLNVPLPCGTGACQACWVEVGQGRRLACVEGPVVTL
jgi:hypothetical protein